jgi:hypothetical protein
MSEFYLGNKNLKKRDVKLEWTQEQVAEYIKCANDVVYFCATYVRIVHVDRGLVQFLPYEYQKRMFNAFDDNRYTICKMPRQVGKTTGVVGYLLHKLLFNENYNVALLANKERQAREILSRMQLAYEWLPRWLQQGIVEWNKSFVELENGSKCYASSTSSSAIRGQSYNLIYLDEFAFVPRNIQDQFFASVFPTISSGRTTKLVITSTPNGMDMFHKIWIESEQEKNTYARVDVHWSDVPGRDQEWADEMIRNTSIDQFRQEFECEFLGSSNTLIHPSILSKLVWYDPILNPEPGLQIYKQPIKDHYYAMTVDVAEGIGLDSSTFAIIDCSVMPYEIVAVYESNSMSELLYPNLLANVGRYYNNAAILVEINVGTQVVNILHHDLEYENIVYTKTSGRKGTQLGGEIGDNKMRMGIKTTGITKRIGCSNLKTIIEQNQLIINDYRIVKQLYTYVKDNSSFNAEDGHHDDLVMCLVLFAWMISQNYFKDVSGSNVRQQILDANEKRLEDEMTPFGIIDAGMPEEQMYYVSDSEFERMLLN